MYILFVSGGNDSVALCQFAKEAGWQAEVAYCDTGWASPAWPERMTRFRAWVELLGFRYSEIASEGMDALITRKKAFPANKPKFCTYELKIKPALAWLERIDPEKSATCVVGVRREESQARRQWPEWVESSDSHGGRSLFSPLARLTTTDRDALISRAGWDVLPHRSRECSPCVNSNRADFLRLDKADIDKVRAKEQETGLTMFRPYRFMGATGIDEVMRWAQSARGQYAPPDSCDAGMCGD